MAKRETVMPDLPRVTWPSFLPVARAMLGLIRIFAFVATAAKPAAQLFKKFRREDIGPGSEQDLYDVRNAVNEYIFRCGERIGQQFIDDQRVVMACNRGLEDK